MLLLITILVLITIFILLSRIEIGLSYKRLNKDDRLTVILKLFRIKLYKFEISMLDVSKGEKGLGIKILVNKIEKKYEDDGKGFIHFETIANIYKDIRKYYKLYTETLKDIRKSLIKATIINEFDVKLEIGVFDHAVTGISTGIIYAFIWNIFSLIANSIKIRKHEIVVNPRFDANILNLNLNCIFQIRIGNIIYVVVRLVALFIVHMLLNRKKIKKTGINFNIN